MIFSISFTGVTILEGNHLTWTLVPISALKPEIPIDERDTKKANEGFSVKVKFTQADAG
tara:strand:+ start:460 stop:636 length:177 start_codon:yes stop_codon:yes gene_type:complete